MTRLFRKADIILLIVLVLIGLFLSWISVTCGRDGKEAIIRVDGKVYGTYSLDENQTVTIEQNNHINKITIKDGRVQMTYSDCKNQVCVDEGAIDKTNQSIVCLPNRVMVEIRGEDEEFDAVAE